jgi:hypothetical protein
MLDTQTLTLTANRQAVRARSGFGRMQMWLGGHNSLTRDYQNHPFRAEMAGYLGETVPHTRTGI